MYRGKRTCKILKEIRAQIAAENDIAFVTSECKHQGDCAGTCPKCEAEVQYLEKELEKRIKLGKVVTVAGLAAAITATSLSATACDAFRPTAGEPAADLSHNEDASRQEIDMRRFTPNYVSNLSKGKRLRQLQQIMEEKAHGSSDRRQLLSFWNDYFVCFAGDTDYYRLYHPEDTDVGALRKGRLLAVTYTEDGTIKEASLTIKAHEAEPLPSPDALPYATELETARALLIKTASQLGHNSGDLRELLQQWWADDYLGTHEWISHVDLYRRDDGSVLWLYFHPSGGLYQLGTDAIESLPSYKSWLCQSITPQLLADRLDSMDVVAWLNSALGEGNVRSFLSGNWCFASSAFFPDGDFFIRADSTQLQHYSLLPLSDSMRKSGVTVDALALHFDEQGSIVSITPERISTSMENAPILQPEEYFTITADWRAVQAMLKRIVNLSSQPQAEAAAQLRAAWEGSLQGQEQGSWMGTSYYYVFTVAGTSKRLWLLFDEKTGQLKEATTADPFAPTGGDPPYDPWYDMWHTTPRDE